MALPASKHSKMPNATRWLLPMRTLTRSPSFIGPSLLEGVEQNRSGAAVLEYPDVPALGPAAIASVQVAGRIRGFHFPVDATAPAGTGHRRVTCIVVHLRPLTA